MFIVVVLDTHVFQFDIMKNCCRWADVSALLNGVKMVWNARQRCMDWSAVLRSADILKKNSRTPVDLKNKWRVMERNGIVPPMP